MIVVSRSSRTPLPGHGESSGGVVFVHACLFEDSWCERCANFARGAMVSQATWWMDRGQVGLRMSNEKTVYSEKMSNGLQAPAFSIFQTLDRSMASKGFET